MLKTIKQLKGIRDDSKDSIILFYIDTVKQKVIDYCNLEELPKGLEIVVIWKVKDMLEKDEGENMTVKSITEGDVSTSFQINDDKDILDDLRPHLMKYRNLAR